MHWDETVIVNAVTGISGAGKTPQPPFHFPNMNENLFAYKIGSHRHMPEIEQIAADIAGDAVGVIFQPYAAPLDRGILATVYAEPTQALTAEDVQRFFREYYAAEPFVQVCTASPNLKDVARTNYCHVYPTVVKGRVVVFAALDNLVKGASGAAVQNLNLMMGLEESAGLL